MSVCIYSPIFIHYLQEVQISRNYCCFIVTVLKSNRIYFRESTTALPEVEGGTPVLESIILNSCNCICYNSSPFLIGRLILLVIVMLQSSHFLSKIYLFLEQAIFSKISFFSFFFFSFSSQLASFFPPLSLLSSFTFYCCHFSLSSFIFLFLYSLFFFCCLCLFVSLLFFFLVLLFF